MLLRNPVMLMTALMTTAAWLPAHAQLPKNQIRLRLGQVDVSENTPRFDALTADFFALAGADVVSVETEDSGFTLSDTVWVRDHFGAEVGAVYLGQYATSLSLEGHPYKIVAKAYGGYAGFVSRVRFAGRIELFGRLGALYWSERRELFDKQPEADENGDAPWERRLNHRREEDVSADVELGLTVDLTETWGLTLSAGRTEFAGMDADTLQVGLSMRY